MQQTHIKKVIVLNLTE